MKRMLKDKKERENKEAEKLEEERKHLEEAEMDNNNNKIR